jgi:hypothetical protein
VSSLRSDRRWLMLCHSLIGGLEFRLQAEMPG